MVHFSLFAQRKRTKRKGALSLGPSDGPALLERAGLAKTPPLQAAGSDSLRARSAPFCDARLRDNGSVRASEIAV
jgi:hypothetical protein